MLDVDIKDEDNGEPGHISELCDGSRASGLEHPETCDDLEFYEDGGIVGDKRDSWIRKTRSVEPWSYPLASAQRT